MWRPPTGMRRWTTRPMPPRAMWWGTAASSCMTTRPTWRSWRATPWSSAPSSPAASARPAASAPRAAWRSSTDRKSTRLNSSHLVISYAVFCLKKKKETTFVLIYLFHCHELALDDVVTEETTADPGQPDPAFADVEPIGREVVASILSLVHSVV